MQPLNTKKVTITKGDKTYDITLEELYKEYEHHQRLTGKPVEQYYVWSQQFNTSAK